MLLLLLTINNVYTIKLINNTVIVNLYEYLYLSRVGKGEVKMV